jgi:tetratricopeptide (TPR) repeat protein
MKLGAIILVLLMLPAFQNAWGSDTSQELDPEFLLKLDIDQLYDLAREKKSQGLRDQALICYLTIIDKGPSGKSELSKHAKAMVLAGIIYFSYGDFSRSLQLFQNSHDIYESLGDQDGIANLLNNIGTIYHKWDDFEKALHYYHQSNDLFERMGMIRRLPLTYNNLGAISIEMGKYEEALELFQRSLEIHKQLGDSSITNLLSNIGVAYQRLQNFEKAVDYFQQAHVYAEKFQNAEHQVISLMNIALIMQNEYKPQQAQDLLHKAMAISQKEGFRNLIRNIYLALSNNSNSLGDHENALYYYREYIRENDFVFNTQKHRELREIQTLHEVDRKNSEIKSMINENELRNRRIRSQKIIIITFGLFSAILLLLTSIFSFQKAKQKASYKHLLAKHQEIQESEKRKQTRISQLQANINTIHENEMQLISQTRNVISSLERNNCLSFSNIPHEQILLDKTREINFSLLKELVPSTPEKLSASSAPPPPEDANDFPSMADVSQKNIASAIIKVMNNEKPYLKYDFSLEKLALMVSSNKKYVSQVINEEFGKGFSNFVNEFRIEESKKILTDDKYANYTLEGIANHVGFKSRSSFNSAFKFFTGETPSSYKKLTKLALYNKSRKQFNFNQN